MRHRWLLVILASCGTSGGTQPGDGGAPPGDASSPLDAPAPPVDANVPSYAGDVQLSANDMGGGAHMNAASASFANGTDTLAVLACAPGALTDGPCCYYHSQETDAGGPLPSLSAGTLTLSAGGTSFDTMTYDPSVQIYPQYADQTGAAWLASAAMAVSAAGGTLPAFSGNIAMPALLAGLSGAGSATLSRGSDWTLTWAPSGAAAKVVVVVFDVAAELKCVADGAAGTLTVPGAAIGHFTAGAAGNYYVGAVARTMVTAGDATIEVSATNATWAFYKVL